MVIKLTAGDDKEWFQLPSASQLLLGNMSRFLSPINQVSKYEVLRILVTVRHSGVG